MMSFKPACDRNYKITFVTTNNYNVTLNDEILIISHIDVLTVRLPNATLCKNKWFLFKVRYDIANDVDIFSPFGQTIDGLNPRTLGGGYSRTLVSNGVNWTFINDYWP